MSVLLAHKVDVVSGLREIASYKGTIDQPTGATLNPLKVVRVRPLFRSSDKAMLYRIPVDIATELAEVCIVINRDRFVRALEEGAGSIIRFVERLTIATEHTPRHLAGRDLTVLAEQPVVVVGQQTVGDYDDPALSCDGAEETDYVVVVALLTDDRLAAGTSVVDVIVATL